MSHALIEERPPTANEVRRALDACIAAVRVHYGPRLHDIQRFGSRARGDASRVYYAMFDAARAALSHVDVDFANAKTHHTIIGRFSLHIVSARGVDSELGTFLNTSQDLRIAADYDQKTFSLAQVKVTVERMERSLSAIASFLGEGKP